MTARRQFIRLLPIGAAALGLAQIARVAHAQQAVALTETDPAAAALGYKEDTTKVDQKKYPNHAPAQQCNNCQLYAGAATAPRAPCGAFGGKTVAAKGWCAAWVKKAA